MKKIKNKKLNINKIEFNSNQPSYIENYKKNIKKNFKRTSYTTIKYRYKFTRRKINWKNVYKCA